MSLRGCARWVVSASVLLMSVVPCAAQSGPTLVAGALVTPWHRDSPDESPWGVRGVAVLSRGLGVEGRWADAEDSRYWSVGLIQMLPGRRNGKTLQPFGALAAGRLSRHDSHVPYVSLAGGVVGFIGPLGLGVDLRYLRGTRRLDGAKVRERHVSFEALIRF